MNVKPIQILLGLVILALFVMGLDVALHHWSTKGLSIEMTGEPPLALQDGGTIRGHLAGAPDAFPLTFDGVQEPVAVDRHQSSGSCSK